MVSGKILWFIFCNNFIPLSYPKPNLNILYLIKPRILTHARSNIGIILKCWPFGCRYWLCLIGCCWRRKWCNGMWNHLTHVFAYSARSKLYVSQKKSSLSTVTKEEWLPRTQNASICAREYYLDRALNQTKRKHNDLMVLLSLLTACVHKMFMLLSRII